MRQRALPFVIAFTHPSRDTRLPVWACAAAILGVSAACYWLLFRLIGALGLW
jgi:hypothetical protein